MKEDMIALLTKMKEQMRSSLLFLSRLKKISISCIQEDCEQSFIFMPGESAVAIGTCQQWGSKTQNVPPLGISGPRVMKDGTSVR
jgi:hypothetical protein